LFTEYTVPGTDDAKDWTEVMEAMDIMELNQVLDTEVSEALEVVKGHNCAEVWVQVRDRELYC
jgi:hypothetical protein